MNKRWRKHRGFFRCEYVIYLEPAGRGGVNIEQTTLIKSIALLKVCFEAEFTMMRALTILINQITEIARNLFSLGYTSDLNIKAMFINMKKGLLSSSRDRDFKPEVSSLETVIRPCSFQQSSWVLQLFQRWTNGNVQTGFVSPFQQRFLRLRPVEVPEIECYLFHRVYVWFFFPPLSHVSRCSLQNI